MIHEPLTATELRRHNAEYIAEKARELQPVLDAMWQPLIDKIEQLLISKGVGSGKAGGLRLSKYLPISEISNSTKYEEMT